MRRKERNMELIIGLLSGALGGNVAGKAIGGINQGTLINSLAGVVGGPHACQAGCGELQGGQIKRRV